MLETTGFAQQLRHTSGRAWGRATGHRFVGELANDTIEDAAYARYLILDYAFLQVLVRHVARAQAVAPTAAAKAKYTAFLSVLTGGEDDYFKRSFKAMGIAPETWQNPPDHPVVSGFRDVMLGFPAPLSYAQVLASLLPVEWVYLTWAKSVADAEPSRFYLKEWIDLHTDPEFESFVTWMAAEMDRLGTTLDATARQEVQAIFDRTIELEIAFFDAAYEEIPDV